jgi:hypothetical protein
MPIDERPADRPRSAEALTRRALPSLRTGMNGENGRRHRHLATFEGLAGFAKDLLANSHRARDGRRKTCQPLRHQLGSASSTPRPPRSAS